MRKWILALTFILLMASLIFPKIQMGNIIVTVQSEEGQLLPGASITLSSPSLKGTRTQVAMANSKAVFRNLPIGIYKIDVTMDGFQPGTLSDIEINLHKTTKTEIIMQLGQAKEILEVVGTGPLVDTSCPCVSTEFYFDAYLKPFLYFRYYQKAANGNQMIFGGRKIAYIQETDTKKPQITNPTLVTGEIYTKEEVCVKNASALNRLKKGDLIIITYSEPGKVVSEATVIIDYLSKKLTIEKLSDQKGKAIFKKIPAGYYSVEVQKKDSVGVKEMDIQVIAGKTCTVTEILR